MEVLQYIYTSWKNGGSNGGYMIYSRSEGISEAECEAIKYAMRYQAPSDLPIVVTPEQIADEFPYSFSYFVLPSGRGCVAQSTYLGRDYSTRFGNYIIYAMVFDLEELPCRPAEFFAESYIKTAMTEEELNATPPVPPLPPLEITEYSSVINDDQLNEFLFDKEEEFAQIIAMLLKARDGGVPLYINDTRENLVLWSAALQRIFPMHLSKRFTFNTYVATSRLTEKGMDYYVMGVRPDDYFQYASNVNNSRYFAIDFLGGHMTDGVVPSAYEQSMAASITMDFEEIEEFGEFLASTSVSEINSGLKDAYAYYRLLRQDEYEHSDENLKAILAFGNRYGTESDNSDIASKLLLKIQEEGVALASAVLMDFWTFICRYCDYMVFTLFDILQEAMIRYSKDVSGPCTELEGLLDHIQQSTPRQYVDYLAYTDSQEHVEHLLLHLRGETNVHTNRFYVEWILKNYSLTDGLKSSKPIAKLFAVLLDNIGQISGSEELMMNILFQAATSDGLFQDILHILVDSVRPDDRERLDALCDHYVAGTAALPERQVAHIERMMLDNPEATPIMARMYAKKIANAKDPEQEFWCFYDNQRGRMTSETRLPLGPMIMACLNHVDDKSKDKVAIEMLRRLDTGAFNNATVVRKVTNVVNDCNVKELIKMDPVVLKRTCALRSKLEDADTGADKIRAVMAGETLRMASSQASRPVTLAEHMRDMPFSMEGFSQPDYETYLKNYFDIYFDLIYGSDDVAVLAKTFFHNRLFEEFTDDYISVLKKMEKKDPSRWLRMVVWTCVYVLRAPLDDAVAAGLYRPVIQYLKSVDGEETSNIQREVARDVPASECDRFFDEIQRKESNSGKFGGFFRRR